MGYVIYHKPSMTRVGYARLLHNAKLGWDLTPGSDYGYMLESEWEAAKASVR